MVHEVTYKVIEREFNPFECLVCAVQETLYGELIGCINRLRPGEGMNHRAYNDIWVDHDQVERRIVLVHKVPRSFLTLRLRNIVSSNRIVVLDCVGSGNLFHVSITRFRFHDFHHTGFQSFSV